MDKIKLIVMNEYAYIWNSEDWFRVRQLRILGSFIGSLAALPRQDQLAGLPLALLKEETKLLIEKGFAETKCITNILDPISKDIQYKNSQSQDQIFLEQSELMKAKRIQQIESKIDIILEGKKAKKKFTDKELTREEVLEEEIRKIEPLKHSALAIQIYTDDPWIKNENYENYQWDYPTNDLENLHYLVFKDLWEKNYYITNGIKFGGDYLVYPGDPIKFHAFFIVICVKNDQKFNLHDLITYGRLGQSVRKTVVLSYLKENKVCYQSVQWPGY